MNYIDFEASMVTLGSDVFIHAHLFKKGDGVETYVLKFS
jgi:hypothetical protein